MNRTFKQLKKISNLVFGKKDTRHPATILTAEEKRMDKYAREISQYLNKKIPRIPSPKKVLKTTEQSREILAKKLSFHWKNQELKLKNFISASEELRQMNSIDAVDVFRRIERMETVKNPLNIKTRKSVVEFINRQYGNFAGTIIKNNFMKGRSAA